MKCSIKKGLQDQSLNDVWQRLLVDCHTGCVVGIREELKALATSHPRTDTDNMDLRIN